MYVQAVALVATLTPISDGIIDLTPVADVRIELCPGDTTGLPVSASTLAWRLDATGAVTVEPSPQELVRQSAELVGRVAALLPVSAEDEQVIDELVRTKSRSKTGRSRPIGRR
jgi:hypothetical protein